MKARTADGHTLQLPDARLGALLPQLHRSGLDDIVRRNYDGDLGRAVARSIGLLANRARRVGTLRSPQTGSRYPVFSTALGGRSFQIVTRPGEGSAGTIVGIRPQASPAATARSAEYMAAPGQPALGARRALTTAAVDATLNVPGIYQIYKDGRLIYVGQSQNVRQRLQEHLLCLTHMAVPVGGYQAAAGVMPGSSQQTRRTEEVRRRDLNRARPGNLLTNERELEAMLAATTRSAGVSAEQRRRMHTQSRTPTPRRGQSGIRGQGPPTVRTKPPDPATLRQDLRNASNAISQAAATIGPNPSATIRALELAQGRIYHALGYPPYSSSTALRNANSRLSTFISRWASMPPTEAGSELRSIASQILQATAAN
ncbi:MAG TPA: GIY-YIG nuclease family protein [Pyrinomonadaceae bacterium]|jgi:hypothetical protein